MKIEQKQIGFQPVTVTIESIEELFVFFAAFGSSNTRDTNHSANYKLQSNDLKLKIKNLVGGDYASRQDILWKLYNHFGALLREQGVFNAEYNTEFKKNFDSEV